MAARLDLKWSLTLRVVAVAVLCLAVSTGLEMRTTYRGVRAANQEAAGIVAQELRTQLFRIGSGIDLAAHFPDWDRVADVLQSPGQCVRFLRPDGSVARSSCVGFTRGAGVAPAWFAALAGGVANSASMVSVPVAYHDTDYGTVAVSIDRDAVLVTLWRDTKRLLGVTALLVGAICTLQFIAIGRALRPTQEILVGLDRLAQGDLAWRLPNFRLLELQRISTVFNQLAGHLQTTLQERMQLAARLAEGHERERLALARELHDELAQNVSAITALAAAIHSAAQSDCPQMLPEAEQLSGAAMAVMQSLRATLRGLRPPEIDDFGLAHSLAALVMDRQRLAGGLQIRLDVEAGLPEPPPATASHIYRVVQEALTNVARHAGARQALVTLRLLPTDLPASGLRRLELTIEDDGSSLPAQAAEPAGNGLGLIGMRERMMALGGTVEAAQRPEGGFRVRAVIPVPAARLP